MRAAIIALKTQVSRTQDSLEDEEVFNMNIQRFSSYLTFFMEEQGEKQSAAKEEFEKQVNAVRQEKTEIVE